ncbi:MAG: bifunctional riboflavin kinase/FMN adenylyltransferase, partial [Aquificota bacterium]
MKVVSLKDLPINEKMVCSIGNFDGFHIGHIKVLKKLKLISEKTGFKSAVLTFLPHPQEFFTGKKLCKIVNLETKKEFLTNQGIDYLILIPFDKNFANLTKDEFINFLKNKIYCKYVIVGNSWRFGKNREGDVNFAKEYGKKIGINFIGIDEEKIEGKKIGSSLIRELLKEGNIEKVNKILGRTYCIKGK